MKEDISANDLKNILQNHKDVILLDVRSKQEYLEGHLSGSISIPSYDIVENVQNVIRNKNSLIIVYCNYGTRGKNAVRILSKLGYTNVYNLKDGLEGLK